MMHLRVLLLALLVSATGAAPLLAEEVAFSSDEVELLQPSDYLNGAPSYYDRLASRRAKNNNVNNLDPPILENSEPMAVQASLFEPQTKPGVLQNLYHSTTRVTPGAADDLGITELIFSGTAGFPFPTREAPLLVTAGFDLFVLDGFQTLDLPGELYDVYVEGRVLRPITDQWTLDLALMPGIYGNSDSNESDFRLRGRAVAIYQWTPTTKAVLGVVYLDRDDVRMLPAAGLIWTPTDYLKFDLLFPKPRAAVKFHHDRCSQWWAYAGGEFGGGSWGMTRNTGAADTVTLSDIRFLLGIERLCGGPTLRVEAGYAFSRQVEYASGIGNRNLDGAGLIRGVISY